MPGVVNSNLSFGRGASRPSLSMVPISNDRPKGAAQLSIPFYFKVRDDFAAALQVAVKAVHERGGLLPLMTSFTHISVAKQENILSCLGRTLDVFPGSALFCPAMDALALARPVGRLARGV